MSYREPDPDAVAAEARRDDEERAARDLEVARARDGGRRRVVDASLAILPVVGLIIGLIAGTTYHGRGTPTLTGGIIGTVFGAALAGVVRGVLAVTRGVKGAKER